MFNFFREQIPQAEKNFRYAILLWVAIFVIFTGSGIIGYLKDIPALLDFTKYPALVFMAYNPALFLYALGRAIYKLFLKEFDLAAGYLVYAGLPGLLLLPVIVGFYDIYTATGRLWW